MAIDTENIEEPCIQLGFVQKAQKEPLSIEVLPTKLGGKPLWLRPDKLPPLSLTTCTLCDSPMALLVQMYTAEDFPEEAYHRYLYIFTCVKGACHTDADWTQCTRVFRAQLPMENKYFKTNEEDTEHVSVLPSWVSDASPTCAVCGVAAYKRCGSCRQTWYCSRAHQVAHWQLARHKSACPFIKDSKPVPSDILDEDAKKLVRNRVVYPEREIVSEPESLDIDATSSKHNNALMPLSRTGLSDEAADDSETGIDKAFLKFQMRLETSPGQVLRYLRTGDEIEPEPLYVSDPSNLKSYQIPPCPRCNVPRTLECQLLSSLLNYLPLDLTDSKSYDFGTYLIYTCPMNCELNSEYAEEVVLRQNFSSDGMTPLRERYERVQKEMQEHDIQPE